MTPRTLQVLELMLEGRSNTAIAWALRIPRDTVTQHLRRIYRFYRVNTAGELMAEVHRQAMFAAFVLPENDGSEILWLPQEIERVVDRVAVEQDNRAD